MKRIVLIVTLAVSVALNAGLAFVLIKGARADSGNKRRASVPPAASTPPPRQINVDAWPTLQPSDLPSLVASLRAEGFPPNIVRAIVSARLTAEFAERRKAIDPDAERRPFWKDQPADARTQTALRQLDFEHQKVLRRLLGDDAQPDDLWSRRQRRDAWAEALSPEKAAEVKRIRQRFEDQRSDLYAEGIGIPDIRAKLAALEKEQSDAVATILSPAELDAYDLRAGRTANGLRSRLVLFEPSEQEFRALYDLQRGVDERFANYGLTGPMTEEQQRERTDANKQLREQFKAVLGPQRFADYERSTDSNYQQTARLISRLELPAETANQVWSVQKDVQERASKIREDRTIPEPQRSAQLAALASDASAKITNTIGPRGFEAYKDNGGWWLVELSKPRPGP